MSHTDIAAKFDEWARSGRAEGMQENHGDVVRQVIERMQFKAGDQVLDLGCGSGWATRLLANGAPGSGAVGVDASPEMIRKAESGHDFTFRARYEVGTFEALDFSDGKFQKAFSMEALYYAVDLDQALAELFRVLAPGATADIVLDRYAESAPTESWSEMMGLEMAWLSEAEWRAKFEAAGFIDVSTERVRDSRGPGNTASEHGDDAQRRALHEAGSLWIHGVKPD